MSIDTLPKVFAYIHLQQMYVNLRNSILPKDLGGPGRAPPAVTPYRARTYVNRAERK